MAVTAKCTLLRKNPSGPQQSPSLGLLPGKEHCRCLGPRPDLPSGSSQGSNRNEPGRPGVSEISRPEADRYCVVSLTCGIKKKKKVKFLQTDCGKVAAREWGVGEAGRGW